MLKGRMTHLGIDEEAFFKKVESFNEIAVACFGQNGFDMV
jgi:hypothetical protein